MDINELLRDLEDHLNHTITVLPSEERGWGIKLQCEICDVVFFDVAWTV